jgi:plastocyanin
MRWRTRSGRQAVSVLVLALTIAGPGPRGATRAEDPAAAGPAPGLVAVEGVVSYDGPLPEPIPVTEAGTSRHLVEVEPDHKGLKDAVVWLEGVHEPAGPHGPAPEEPVVMDQRNYFFVPHVLAVEAGRVVEFRNSDGANHGVTATSLEPGNRFNVVTPQGGGYKHRFVASRSPVMIGCPIHVAMAAWIFVFDHQYFAVTDESGRFRLPPVPPGRYTLQVRHPDGRMSRRQEIVVRRGEPLRLRVAFHGEDRKP